MDEHQISLTLPDNIYQRLQEIATAASTSLEEVLLRTITTGLPPSLSKVPHAFHNDLLGLNRLDDQDLWRVVTGELAYGKALSPEQRQADFVSLRRAYAFALLKWRGHPMPEPAEFFVE